MKLDIINLEKKNVGSIDLPDAVFGQEVRTDILHRVVRWQRAKAQAGTHSVLGKSDVSYSTKKIYRQKGTGGARHGSKKAPIFRHGGTYKGPTPRSHAHDLPKKFRALGLRHALSAKAKDAGIIVIDDAKLSEPKTKVLLGHFGKLELSSALIIGGAEIDTNFGLAARSIPNVDVLPVQGINVYDILRRDKLVLTRAAVDALEARFK